MTAARRDALALHGGPMGCPAGPPPWPRPDPAVWAALERVYRDGDWGRYHGPNCAALANEIAARHGVTHAAVCCSGTIAIELALRGLQVGPGDEVVLAAYDFPGNFRAIEALGAAPVLVDVDPENWGLDHAQLAAAISPRVKAIIASHLHGGVAPMREVMEFAAAHSLFVVEDACQCPGAEIEGRPAGAWGDVGVWSFGGSKLLTAGRGGAVFTRHAEVLQRIKIYSDRGNQAFPLSELQAAVLRPQLARLDGDNALRAANVARLLAGLESVAALAPLVNRVAARPAYYKLGFRYRPEHAGGAPRDEFLAAVQAEGIALDAGFRGFAQRTARRCRAVDSLPHARAAAANAVILHHPVLLESAEVIDRVAATIRKVAAAFARG